MAKQRLTENFSKDWGEPLNIKKLPIQESVTEKVLIEGAERQVISKWEVPVWRLDKRNLNGRIYKMSLGERVVREFGDLVTANLADHPEEDGSVKDILGVAKNPHIRDGILYVDAYIVDEAFEKKLYRMVEVGYGMGVSSSILGDLDDDKVVIDESVEVERWFDYVLNPSYSVFITKDCERPSTTITKLETVVENLIEDTTTIKYRKEPIKESKNMSEDKIKALTEKTMRMNLDKIIADAENKGTIAEKLAALNEAASYVSDDLLPDVQTTIKEKLAVLTAESLALAEKGKTVEALNESISVKESEKTSLTEKIATLEEANKNLQSKYELATKLLDESKEYANKAVDLLEIANADAGSKFSAGEYVLIVEELEAEQSRSKELSEKIQKFEKSLNESKEALALTKASLKEKTAKIKELEEAIAANNYDQEVADGLMNEEDIDYENPDAGFDYGTGVLDNSDDELELDLSNDAEVQDYYTDLVDGDPRYESVKEDILKCKTVLEAQRTALRLKDLVESQPSKRRMATPRTNQFQVAREKQAYKEADASNCRRKGWK